MLAHQEKISFRQAMVLFIVLMYSPVIRFFPLEAALEAKQAGWLIPLASFVFFALLIWIFHSFYKKNKDASFMDLICIITGKYPGYVILAAYLAWLTILLALYIRYYSIRINIATSPTTDESFFIIVMLVLAAVVLRYGLVIFTRMSEIILLILVIGFIAMSSFSISNIRIDNLTPISYLDILPVLKGSYSQMALYIYFMVVFFFSDKINDKEKIKSTGLKAAVFLIATHTIIAVMTIGTAGYSVIARTSLPFFVAVKNLSVFEAINRVEALSVTQWITADFILIVAFAYSILCIVKYLFKLSGTKSLVSILMVFMYIFSLYLTKSMFELQEFSVKVAVHLNILFGFAIPVLLFIVGKIRKVI